MELSSSRCCHCLLCNVSKKNPVVISTILFFLVQLLAPKKHMVNIVRAIQSGVGTDEKCGRQPFFLISTSTPPKWWSNAPARKRCKCANSRLWANSRQSTCPLEIPEILTLLMSISLSSKMHWDFHKFVRLHAVSCKCRVIWCLRIFWSIVMAI